MAAPDHNARRLLLDLGVGDFNATLIIPLMFMGPAQSDPDMTQVKVLTRAMQKTMQSMGATWIVPDGYIGHDTAALLAQLGGAQWNQNDWFDLVTALLNAKTAGKRFSRASASSPGVDLSGLPDVSAIPGGYITLGIGAYLLYRHLKKGR